jgi:hypothetical protein
MISSTKALRDHFLQPSYCSLVGRLKLVIVVSRRSRTFELPLTPHQEGVVGNAGAGRPVSARSVPESGAVLLGQSGICGATILSDCTHVDCSGPQLRMHDSAFV